MSNSNRASQRTTNTANDPFIRVYEGVLSADQCQKVMEKFDKDERVEDDPQPDYSTRRYLNLSRCADWMIPLAPFIEQTDELATDYFARPQGLEDSGIQEWLDDGFIMAHYRVGDALVLHADGQTPQEPGNGLRLATVLFFLNDCEGGELSFPLQEVVVKPKQGQAILFPPFHTHPHEVLECRSDRYVLQTWLTHHELKVTTR